MLKNSYRHLYRVNSPEDLKGLEISELEEYCTELRGFIVKQLSENPGHLASSLGTVEITTAMHYVYNTPHDKLIWDVGHQAYAHKIITGRRDVFSTNRKLGGLSGFPKIAESIYDSFGGGHSSVSISAALGIATAAKLKGEKMDIVAIIGDGAMTGGLAFEGLNNAGAANTDILVILNDNNMSIDANVGALNQYLLKITTSKRYNQFKSDVWKCLAFAPRFRRLLQLAGSAMKQGLLHKSNLFESLNFRYFGTVDGHDVVSLVTILEDLKTIKGPKLLHIITTKGKGYVPAEENQAVWHAPGRFNPETGERVAGAAPQRYQDIFGEAIVELAKSDDKIVGITPAMPTGCSLNIMMEQMPERCFDVGIAEGHAVTFSAGLATQKIKPFCNIYSSFMQRAYDNVIHDVAIQGLGVVFCLDRGGIVGEDGATHHGAFDIAYMRCIPNMVVSSPLNAQELRDLMYTASVSSVPFVIRYPRGAADMAEDIGGFRLVEIGKSQVISEGSDVALMSFGSVGNFASRAIERVSKDGISVKHVDLRFAKPLDTEMLHSIGANFKSIVTVEDGTINGGVGSAIADFMITNGYCVTISKLGMPDEFVEHGTPNQLHQLCGYDEESIYNVIKNIKR